MGWGNRELVFNGDRSSVWEGKKTPEMENGESHAAV